jgi:PAS domain S-box-containing protein
LVTQELFDQHITLTLKRLEALWQQADKLQQPSGKIQQPAEESPLQQQELLKESLNELSNSIEELQVAVEELRQQNEELVASRTIVAAERQRYQELFEFAPDGYLVTSKEGTICEVNRTAAQLLNVSQQRLVGKPLVLFIAAEERQNFYIKLSQLQKGEFIKNWRVSIQRRCGECFKASFTVAPVQDAQSQIVGLRWRLLELTCAPDEEQENLVETRFHALYPSSMAGKRAYSVNGTGGGERESNGKFPTTLCNKQTMKSSPYPLTPSSSTQLPSEYLFRAMFESAANGIVLLDSEGRVIRVNRVLQQMLGCDEQELETVVPELMNLDKSGVESALFQELMAGKRRSYQLEKRFKGHATPMQWGRLTVSLVQGNDAEPLFATCLLEDITEFRQAEEAQRQLLEQLKVSDQEQTPTSNPLPQRDYEYTISPINESNSKPEAVVVTVKDISDYKRATTATTEALAKQEEFSAIQSHFISVISHELRNPLNNIFSCARLIEDHGRQWTEEKKFHYLQRIQVNVKRINQLLDDLLLIGKVEAGQLQVKPALIDLVEFCRELIKDLQQDAAREYQLTFRSQGQRSGIWDEKLLRQILTNLLLNAIKYSPKGSEIKLDILCQGRQAIFRIQDSGIGIPKKDKELLFKAFHRGTNVGAVAGNGLGLSIVKQCVDLQNGEISVESEVGVGTTFTVTLPLNYRPLKAENTSSK